LVGGAETLDKAGCPTIFISIMVVIIASRDTESGFRGDGKCYSQRPAPARRAAG
jgi:hypothetical protein